VLAGYGTGAVMAVPSGDQRDFLFAKHFHLNIIPILDTQNITTEADPTKEGKYINSDFINGLTYKEATAAVIAKLELLSAGRAKINFRMRDAIFGRQRRIKRVEGRDIVGAEAAIGLHAGEEDRQLLRRELGEDGVKILAGGGNRNALQHVVCAEFHQYAGRLVAKRPGAECQRPSDQHHRRACQLLQFHFCLQFISHVWQCTQYLAHCRSALAYRGRELDKLGNTG